MPGYSQLFFQHINITPFGDNKVYTCKICKSSINLAECKQISSTCFFNHVPLDRYICPVCDVIFGTLDMINGTMEKIKGDYLFCDKTFVEHNSIESEVKTFLSINPKKEGVYLNFGCGNKCTTIPQLRKQGWNIIGYEPFVPNDQPNIIKDKTELAKMRFNGVISNNLLEHLQDPVEDLLFMKSLLKDKSCLMAHSTACYKYLYEYSMYHLYFFLGKSVEHMCKSAGLIATLNKDEITPLDGEYINYIYAQK